MKNHHGLIIFVVLVSLSPSVRQGDRLRPPKLVDGTDREACVEPTPYMKTSHMKFLEAWRDEVVRKRSRVYTELYREDSST